MKTPGFSAEVVLDPAIQNKHYRGIVCRNVGSEWRDSAIAIRRRIVFEVFTPGVFQQVAVRYVHRAGHRVTLSARASSAALRSSAEFQLGAPLANGGRWWTLPTM